MMMFFHESMFRAEHHANRSVMEESLRRDRSEAVVLACLQAILGSESAIPIEPKEAVRFAASYADAFIAWADSKS